jgi:hypothetical protein
VSTVNWSRLRDGISFSALKPLPLAAGPVAGSAMAESASKGELLRVVERLVAEDEHGEAVAVHRRFDRAGLRGAERLAEVQALHLGGEDGCSGVSGRPGSPFTADEVSCLPAIASFPCSRQALPARLRPLFAPSAL